MGTLSFQAIIFDLDGVITNTAKVHALAWKSLFDSYLRERSLKFHEPFKPFDLDNDYLSFVDGKSRYDGVASFLHSRNIDLPFGSSNDNSDQQTICGLGNRKDNIFNNVLKEKGVEIFDSTVQLILQLKSLGIRIAVASSSKNCRLVLEIADLQKLFEFRVDGLVAAQDGLKGKPAPDIFLKCTELLKVLPENSIVVEDAISGVQAGRNGHFGLVIGLDRVGLGNALNENGADIVLQDLSQASINNINRWFKSKNNKK